jgi:SNF family Na+-dependent transporter
LTGKGRESWGSRLGVILAAAGSAVGIGNLLRFPGQAANHGGGGFMIPYVLSMLLFGLPVMWIAWSIGRMGGRWGHGTTPGMFDRMTGRWWGKYIGVIGVALPLIFILYYTYIEAWCLGYAWFSLSGAYDAPGVDTAVFFQEFLGAATTHNYFGGIEAALLFLGLSIALNVWVLYRGVSRGIELLAKIAIPLLMLFAIVLGVWVLSLGREAWAGLEFLWRPRFEALLDFEVWMAAAGQIFFTLTLGYGALECFGSYLSDRDDVALTGLTAASLNEFVEVIFGSLIAIPAAAAFFGAARIPEIAAGGTYSIGMVSMPEIFRGMGGAQLFGTMWFLLLFFAAFTSSVAVAQPVMAFLQDEARLSRTSATALVLSFWLLGSIPVAFFYRYGALDEMDFWAGTIGLVVFATIEVIIFSWLFGIDHGWREIHLGAEITVPGFFKPVMKYVTPIALLAVFGGWFFDAIIYDKLVPAPSLHVGFVDPGPPFEGRFLLHPPAEDTAEADELVAIETRLQRAVDEAGRDLDAWVDLVLFQQAPGRISAISGDPRLLQSVSGQSIARYVRLLDPRYERGPGETARPVEVTLRFEGRYRATVIWTVRIMMIVVNIVFLMMIRSIWTQRRTAGATAEVA